MNTTDAPMDTPHPLHERVELIVHLLKFSDRLFAIMSPATDELHTFTDLLIKEGGAGLLIARVHPDLALNAEDVATDLAKAWGIELNLGESAMQAIEQRLPERLPEPRRAVAIIEDVERLPSQALDELIGFMQRLDDQTGGRVRLALLGGSNLAGQLQHMQSLETGGQVYALHLTPPPAEAFADMANSVPGDAPPAFERPAPRGGEAPTLPGRALLIGGVAASLALAVAIALLMRPGEPEVAKDQQVSVPLKSETVASLPVAPLPAPTPGAVTGEPAVPAAPAPIGHQLTDSPASPPPPPAPVLPAPPPAEVKPSAPVAMAEPKPSAPAAMPAAEPKPSLAAPKPSAQPAKKATNWYAQQKADQYVLQVVSLKSEAEVDRFIKQNGLKDCHSFRQLRDGQTLHTLTCGLYPSRDAASQAAAKLPEKARAGKPFPRRIDDIRKIMQP
ncbi:SPOR domain-containing protein [Thiofaba sp. EF100]|uniref:SPOR domain-containing protein n=1 Tax=Thiofaba sp. EF100 TaxID=3121274 RepID=UPI003221837B